jgi:hypothetical protein
MIVIVLHTDDLKFYADVELKPKLERIIEVMKAKYEMTR